MGLLLNFNSEPASPEHTEFTKSGLARVRFIGVYDSSKELRAGLSDRQRGRTAEDVLKFIGEICGMEMAAHDGWSGTKKVGEDVDAYTEVLTEGWQHEEAISIFRTNFQEGAFFEGVWTLDAQPTSELVIAHRSALRSAALRSDTI